MNNIRIASIEDDESISLIISKTLQKQGFEVFSYYDGESFLDDIKRNPPSLILLDLMLPNIQGREVLKEIRKNKKYDDIHVIVVSAKSMTSDKVELLDLGADDYLTKPFEISELVSRVKAQFRRNQPKEIKKGRYHIDLERGILYVRNKEVDLTASEFLIVKRLLEADGKIVTRDDLVAAFSSLDASTNSKALDMHLRSIRKKLGEDSIKSIYGSGYRIIL